MKDLRVGLGHQVLVSHLGQNNLTIYEKVAASAFGKGFGEAYSRRPDANAIIMGRAEALKEQKFEGMVIAGVASDRRDPGKEPPNGWAQQARTIVRVGFGDNPTKFIWYTRSTLGQRFGQVLVDEEIMGFSIDAGQEEPLPPTRRVSRARKALVMGSSTVPDPPQSVENLAPSNGEPMAALLAKLGALEAQIRQISKGE